MSFFKEEDYTIMSFFKEEDYTLISIPIVIWVEQYSKISEWLMTLPDEDWEYDKSHVGTAYIARGLYFRYKEDIIAFKIRFGV